MIWTPIGAQFMTTALSGANAFVTGATAGIAHAVALQLESEGANAIVHGRDAGRPRHRRLEQLAAERALQVRPQNADVAA